MPAPPTEDQPIAQYPNTRGAARRANQRPSTGDEPRGTEPPHTHTGSRDSPVTHNNKKKNMRANINIATLNMNGLTSRSKTLIEKWTTVNQTLNKYKIAILAIQETHLDEDAANKVRECFSKKIHLEFSSDPNAPRSTAGVAFVINKSLIAPNDIQAQELFPGRALALRISWLESEHTNLINIYAPVNRNAHQPFWTKVEAERTLHRIPRPDFMLGDLNVTENLIDRNPAHTDDQSATESLRETRLQWNICNAWRESYPDDRKYTYRATVNSQQIKSRLDRIYVADRLTPLTFDWKHAASPVPTDHWIVVVKYAPKDAPSIGKGRWTMPLHLLKNKRFMNAVIKRGIKLQEDLDALEAYPADRDLETPQRLWEDFKTDIQEIAKEIMGTSHHRINTCIQRLEKDRDALANHPDADTNDEIRTNEAHIAQKLEHLVGLIANDKSDKLRTELAVQGEKLGGVWSAMNKEKKPRDLIRRLKIPDSNPPQYERDSERMADLAKRYHDNLQYLDLHPEIADKEERTSLILNEIPKEQTLKESDAQAEDHPLTETQTEKALHLSKNGSATGMDGCPYELWKTLKTHHERASKTDKPSFNIIKTMTRVFADIQTHGVDRKTSFALGWMCPIYKKKDRTEISNYRPITLLNTDYKLLTKAMAIQLMNNIEGMVHRDQAGFIPNRSILDQVRLAQAIISYAEAAEVNGAIVALDQEKAYDKIRHEYLWEVLNAFNLPDTFTRTLKSLYQNASTMVAINGFFSDPFKITRGIRQGDPLSCAIFDLAIEPLACLIRKDPNLKGIKIPGIKEPLKAKFFADDTSLYMNETDKFDTVQMVLQDWCLVSGAKFNIEKTEVIPIGTIAHRNQVVRTRKINEQDENELNEHIRIADEGQAIRFLGAWIGNHTNDETPWEPIIDKVNRLLGRWGMSRPTMKGRKTIVQAVIGGCTQYLTMAQGMPPNVEAALTKIARDFMWNDDSSPRLALDILYKPITEGGLKLLDIKTRNEAIEIMWLKSYLNLSPSRPAWATVTDLLIDTAAPLSTNAKARENPFLQSWKPATRGKRAEHIGDHISRMLKVAKKYNTSIEALRLTTQLRAQLPAWYHIASDAEPIRGTTAKCLLNIHKVSSVADLMKISACIRNPDPNQNPPHRQITFCYCQDCCKDRTDGCRNPNACAEEAQKRLEQIAPKLNPLSPGYGHGDLSLTGRRKRRNMISKTQGGEILFDPSITCKRDLTEAFRIFTDPSRSSTRATRRSAPQETRLRLQEVSIYTDGACINNGKANARSGSGVWYGPNHEKNIAFRVPGDQQSNQVGELVAIILATEATPINQPLKIITDSRYAIEGLTTHLHAWEDQGWINIQNANLFKRAAYLLKRRTARTSFKWIKGHAGDQGNEGSDRLAKEGATKDHIDDLDLSVPQDFDLQGAKLATLNQRKAYSGIRERKKPHHRRTTDANLQLTRVALEEYNGDLETDATIWKSIQNPNIRIKVRQFLYKAMHGTQKVGNFWRNVPGLEERGICQRCQTTESMDHILIHCNERTTQLTWQLARNLWPHELPPWPEITIGLILGCGSMLGPPRPPTPDEVADNRPRRNRGATRLLQILISEAAHLIWVLRCERTIHEKSHTGTEIERRWRQAINRRLTEDKITATKVKRDIAQRRKVKGTWEPVLGKPGDLPDNWMNNREFLVGTRVRA